ncbi:hypothetical protein CDAR_266031 [Caerostris darwini]|uniref:Uncharacterized protein n=1 Tax=Caerostris darwini TaxID=1538125 RepID=A0AAV4QW27_9ARAC|nr:hypothetical protein CDAR_266031 [Caerostris darwini]
MFNGKGAENYTSYTELGPAIMTTIAMTFSAKTVQLKANEVRVYFLCSKRYKYSKDVDGKWIKLFEDRNVLSLTAWRMFTIRRSILFLVFLAFCLWTNIGEFPLKIKLNT